ncbi:hypothetical protein [Citrobacter sedlakii]
MLFVSVAKTIKASVLCFLSHNGKSLASDTLPCRMVILVDRHSSASQKQKPRLMAGFSNELKLTGKPLSFGYSVVDRHSSASQKQKPRLMAGFQ